jgi:hypothetical protein
MGFNWVNYLIGWIEFYHVNIFLIQLKICLKSSFKSWFFFKLTNQIQRNLTTIPPIWGILDQQEMYLTTHGSAAKVIWEAWKSLCW